MEKVSVAREGGKRKLQGSWRTARGAHVNACASLRLWISFN